MKIAVRHALQWFAALLLAVAAVVGFNCVRHVAFWSPTEDVTFASGDIRIAGKLVTKQRWNYYIDAGRNPERVATPERDEINARLLAELRASVPFADQILPEELLAYDAETYAALASDYGYDPVPFLRAIEVPMMYLFGENDRNVPTSKSVDFLESFRAEYGKDIDIVVFEDVGHPQADWTGLFTAGYLPAYLDLVGSWMSEQAALE
jgi:pimeloyl-ACP methyl ester carboxylesterase